MIATVIGTALLFLSIGFVWGVWFTLDMRDGGDES